MRLLRRRTRKAESENDNGTAASPTGEPAGDDLAVAFDALLDREWDRLAGAGTWWTGEQRVAIAAQARAAADGTSPDSTVADSGLDAATAEAARRVAVAPATIRATDVEDWATAGLDRFAYVELVGVVSRLAALDVASFGLGRERRPLPEPKAGKPTFDRPDEAEITTGWAPTIGPASAPSSLSAVPPESEAMFDLHGVLYASLEQMFDLRLDRNGLNRPQIELVAARTSRLNDCFY